MLNNARMLSSAADQYFLEHGKTSASFNDIVGPGKLVPVLTPVAQERYPDLALVWISAPPELLRARLADRGRESGEAIAARLERALTFNVPLREPDLRLDNVGRSEHAGGKLVEYLRGAIRASTSHL